MEDPIAVLQHPEMEDMKKEIAQLKEEIKCMRALIMTNYDSAIKCTHSTADALFKKMLKFTAEGFEDYMHLRDHFKGIDAVRKKQIDSLQRQISELQTKP
jgi:polyhydroxyalkanoate synthesis regulator phasin